MTHVSPDITALTESATRRARFRKFAVLAGTFVCGSLAGMALDRSLLPTHPGSHRESVAYAEHIEMYPSVVDVAVPAVDYIVDQTTHKIRHAKEVDGIPAPYAELRLTGDQAERIKLILAVHQEEADAVLGGALPKLRAITDDVGNQIDALLTHEQLSSVKSYVEEKRAVRVEFETPAAKYEVKRVKDVRPPVKRD